MTPEEIRDAMEALGLGPVAFSRALGIPYDTLKNWLNGRNEIPRVGVRCVELLLLYPRTAQRLALEWD